MTGLKIKELSTEWHDAIRAQYAPVLAANKRASVQGRWITADQKNRGALAVSPSLSPDGRRLMYLSERDMLSVDLYVADAETGHVIRRLVNTAIDPLFSVSLTRSCFARTRPMATGFTNSRWLGLKQSERWTRFPLEVTQSLLWPR